MNAKVNERTSEMPIGNGETREGGARPRMCRYQNSDHSSIGKLWTALGPLLEGKDAKNNEGPIQEQEEQADIDSKHGLEEPRFHRPQSSFFRSTTRRRPAITIPMMIGQDHANHRSERPI